MSKVPKKRARAKSRPAKQLTAIEQVQQRRFQIWQALDPDGVHAGFLITEAGNIDRPIGFAFSYGDNIKRKAWDAAIKFVAAIGRLGDPWQTCYAGLEQIPLGATLFDCGKPDSIFPMPAWIYALICTPVDEAEPNLNSSVRPDLLQARSPRPWCRFLIEQLLANAPNAPREVKSAACRAFRNQQRRRQPIVSAGRGGRHGK